MFNNYIISLETGHPAKVASVSMIDFPRQFAYHKNMNHTQTKNAVLIPKREYLRLKKIDERFGKLLVYVNNLRDIADARKEIRQKKVISQEKLFERLGF